MKKYRIICTLSAVAALLSVSCSKENTSIEPQNPEGAKTIQISISGEFSDFASTKASVESIFRMKWAGSENVYVYGTSDGSTIANLGTLTAKVVDDSDNRVADLSGTITAPTSGTKLTLVYSPLFSSAPSVSSGVITQSLASQEGGVGDVTFIAYATVDYGGATTSTYRTSFKFATSVLRVNVSGMEESKYLTSATISDIETTCKLTIQSDAEPTVEGETESQIVKAFDKEAVNTNAKGNIAFYVALPVTAANTGRSLSIVETSSHTYLYPKFATGEVSTGGNMLNTIAAIPTPVKYTENSVDLGYGTFIPETGVIWAPVNCGYDSKNYTYGKLYQWGRKYGQGYNDSSYSDGDYPEKEGGSQLFWDLKDAALDAHPDGDEYNCYFYRCLSNWYGGGKLAADDLWGATKTDYDPCPSGWRVPTYDELNALINDNTLGWTEGVSGQNGFYFNGTSTCKSSTEGNKVFLPAAGYRSYGSGDAGSRGGNGYYWSSSVNGNYATYLYFYNGSAYMYDSDRADGYSVRCVQE